MDKKDVREVTKAEALDRILKEKSNVVRVVPIQGYGHKMQTIRSNKVEA